MKMKNMDGGTHVPRASKMSHGPLKFPGVFHRLVVDPCFFSLKFVLWLLNTGTHYFLNSVFFRQKELVPLHH